MAELKINKTTLPYKILNAVSRIQTLSLRVIEFAHFGSENRHTLEFQNEFFINIDHPSFNNVLRDIDQVSEEIIYAYFSGSIGLELKS
jgi:hypothetical protein